MDLGVMGYGVSWIDACTVARKRPMRKHKIRDAKAQREWGQTYINQTIGMDPSSPSLIEPGAGDWGTGGGTRPGLGGVLFFLGQYQFHLGCPPESITDWHGGDAPPFDPTPSPASPAPGFSW